ncbi:MAG: ribose-phosphate diphosphokinase, partial [Candidatus Aenigmatarchaeota archaeon]
MTDGLGSRYALAVPNYTKYGIDGTPIGNSIWDEFGEYQKEFDKIPITIERFGDGGDRVRIEASPQDREVFVPHFYYANTAAEHTLIGAQIADALKRAGAAKIYLLETYNPYYRQDTRTQGEREPVTAGIVADIYVKSGIDRTYVFDPHFRQLEGFFPSAQPMTTLDLTEKFAGYLLGKYHKELSAGSVGCATDDGSVRLTKRLMKALWHEIDQEEEKTFVVARMDKDRLKEADGVRTNALFGNVDKDYIIVREDVMGTGTTMKKTVGELREKNKNANIIVVSSYTGVLPNTILDYFRNENIEIVTTDGIPAGVREEFNIMKLAPIIKNVVVEKVRRHSLSDYMA